MGSRDRYKCVQVHWEPCGAGPGSNAAAANSLAAIINSSLYKLSLGE